MMKAQELEQLYKSLLSEELKVEGRIDKDGDLVFEAEDLGTLYFGLDAESDPEFMMLVFPNFATPETLGLSRDQFLLAINAVNGTSKAAKLFVPSARLEENCEVSASVECFLAPKDRAPEPALLRATFQRNMSALIDSVRNLVTESARLRGQGT